jgi:hypothetical protein
MGRNGGEMRETMKRAENLLWSLNLELKVNIFCNAVFHIIQAIGTTDVWIIIGFQTMEHTKVGFLIGLRSRRVSLNLLYVSHFSE